MKKSVAFLLIICLMMVSAFGCTQTVETTEAEDTMTVTAEPATGSTTEETAAEEAATEKPITIGISIISLSYPYYAKLQDGLVEKCEEKGWDYILTEANMDVEKTLNDCADLVQKGVDALVIASWYGDSMGEVYDLCEQAGIPIFFIDTGGLADDGGYVTNVGALDYDAGLMEGYWTAQQLLAEGKTEANYLDFTSATTVGKNRVDGFQAGAAQAGLTLNVLHQYLGDTRESFMASCEDALTAYPVIDLIFGASAQAGLGCYDAVIAASRSEITVVGYDAEDDEKTLIDTGTQYIASVELLPYDEAAMTIQYVEDYFNGATFEKFTSFPAGMYTKDGHLTSEDVFGS